MAGIQQRGDSWRVYFRYQRIQHTLNIGRVTKAEAKLWLAKVDEKLLRLKQGLLDIPPGMTVTDFIMRDGKVSPQAMATTFDQLHRAYIAARSNGSLEANTLATAELHLSHLSTYLGRSFLLSGFSHQHLQEYVNKRSKDTVKAIDAKRAKLSKEARKTCPVRHVSAVTIRKEVSTFRQAWAWGFRAGLLTGTFPSAGLSYPRIEETAPFATWEQIERQIKAGASSSLWESLYLDAQQIKELLDHFQAKNDAREWIYPMLACAALTGARRAELMRMTPGDVDLQARVIIIREKKKAKGKNTQRRVPMIDRLVDAITPLMEGRKYLFGDGQKPMTADKAKQTFRRLFKPTKWKVVRGFHVFRHSFISVMASRGTDQRVIDDMAGHSTDAQRKRYRHLAPQVSKDAVSAAFG
ncbi:MAG: site-specific integrase [Planctomycetaceae bacterium]|nr:site-specific integrase [Planctomycetaceae bacterium]